MKNLFFLAFFFAFFTNPLSAQIQSDKYEVSGTILDKTSSEPLVGAHVIYEKAKAVTTDENGNFNVLLANGEHTLRIIYIGYTPFIQKVSVNNGNVVVGQVSLSSTNELDEVEIAADVARTRETPIAFSDIDAKQISEELGANDLPMLLNSTPGAYASQQGGGAGDSRVNIRGFDQRNIAVLVDGVPVNDMENGQVYWSNWAGLSEVTRKMQVQRGLGASRLALPSVGGVMNIITQSVDQQSSFVVKNDMGTNNYHRFAIGYNSGLIKNKFGATLAASYTQGDGIVDMTWQKAWSYYAKFSYKINEKNLLVFSVSGAPQSHGQRSFAINMAYHDKAFADKQGINTDSMYALPYNPNKYTNAAIQARGVNYSPDWGYVNGKAVNAKINYFHKPLMNLSYFLTINPRLSFSNVLYMSIGRGGGTSLSTFPSYDKNGTGQLMMQTLYDANLNAPATKENPFFRPSYNYVYSSVNNHTWVGTLSTFKYRILSNLDFLGGLDARYYTGEHYQTPYDYLGGEYVIAPAGKDLNMNVKIADDPLAYFKTKGDKINYYYKSRITWLGLFGQLEYKTKNITAFVTLTGNESGYQNINYFAKKDIVLDKDKIVRNSVGFGDTLYYDGTNYGVRSNPNALPAANPNSSPITTNPDGSITFMDVLTKKNVTIAKDYSTFTNTSSKARANTSQMKYYTGYTLKGGMNYKLNQNHNVFFNVGYMNLAPKFSNIYDRSGAEIKNVKNQLILTAELGYSIKYRKLAINLNGYITSWGNKPLDFSLPSSKLDSITQLPIYFNVTGVDALLKGFEFDFSYRLTRFLEIKGFGALADWRWNSGGTSYAFNEVGARLDSVKFDAKGVHIGNAPQKQLGGSLRFELFKNRFYIKPQYTYFGNMYAQFDPTNLKVTPTSDFRKTDSWKMPEFGVLDLYMGYTLPTSTAIVTIVASMNNVLNTVYMTDANFSVTPDKYNALNSYGWMGLGRRVNFSVKLTF